MARMTSSASSTAPPTSPATPLSSSARLKFTSRSSKLTPAGSARSPARLAYTPARMAARLRFSPGELALTPTRVALWYSPEGAPKPSPLSYSPMASSPSLSACSPLRFMSSPTTATLKQALALEAQECHTFGMALDPQDLKEQFRRDAIERSLLYFEYAPKEEQLQVVEHVAEQKDCVLLAPCGWGKTLAYFLPMVIFKHSITVIISPLIALIEEQMQKLDEYRIPNIFFTSERNNRFLDDDAISQMLDGHYRAVFMTPELYFGSGSMSKKAQKLWSMDKWKARLLCIVVDELHCVERWGMTQTGKEAFRPEYSLLGQLRCQAPQVPIVGLTATLTDDQEAKVKRSLFQYKDGEPLKIIKVDDLRDNLSFEVQIFQGQHRSRNLASLLDDGPKKKTLVYFDSIAALRSVQDELVKLRPGLKIGAYYSTLRAGHKQDTMSEFKDGKINVLLATDAAGMGCDIPDVTHVIQYDLPLDLTSLVQRFGRAARNPLLVKRGIVTLLAPPITSSKYIKRPDLKELVRTAKDKDARHCCWELIAKRFNITRKCNQLCEGCTGATFSAKFPICLPPAPIKIPTEKRTDEEKQVGRRKFLEWRKKTYKKWAGEDEPMTDGETWILPDSAVDKLCERLSHATTAKGVRDLARICGWRVMEEYYFDEVAQVAIAALDETKGILNNPNVLEQAGDSSDDRTKGASGSAATSGMDPIHQLLRAAAYI
ncbi:P-loop containing nucleoside triphosphate hydrolase protein [Linnemannia elongata]|nr:P-loop containing nucleoside triphosphate hydrolase protein [Linnemannia elongata]